MQTRITTKKKCILLVVVGCWLIVFWGKENIVKILWFLVEWERDKKKEGGVGTVNEYTSSWLKIYKEKNIFKICGWTLVFCYVVCCTAFMFLYLENKNLIQHPFSGFSSYRNNIFCTKKRLSNLFFSFLLLVFFVFRFCFNSFLIVQIKETPPMRLKQTTINNKASNYEQIKDICADDYGRWLLLLLLFMHCSCLS